MASEFEELTVAELKELLRECGKPVSGTKSVLIERLEEFESQDKEEKIEFDCNNCGTRLRIPESYHGLLTCPSCSNKQDSSEVQPTSDFGSNLSTHVYLALNKIKNFDPKNISQNQISLATSILGVGIGILAIILFFSSFSYELMCPEEARGTVIYEGEEVLSCHPEGMIWETDSAKRIFNSCCILVPLSLLLTIIGYNIRKKKVTIINPNTEDGPHLVQSEQISDSKITKVIQVGGLGFGIGLGVISILLVILVLVFIIFVIYLVLSN
jgi:ssDNA-binding Zn-finger/Zn-ribbon topoisomerase 1